ncbi:ferritin-like domain-containing protein [Actinoplanes sp. CA-051413]|uniref:YciE/YciF ferroxidase family protein n=1 Tax=Actinoplanes sp. CA-051413 TaxID=3239899 RepID=UPI003D95CC9B
MTVPSPEDAFLFDLSRAYAGERTALQILEQGAGEVVDERAGAVLTRHAEETRAQLRGLEQVFSLFDAQPQALSCPALEGIRHELDLFRQQDPAPELLTVTTLFANLKIEHNEIATYGSLIDKAVLLGQLEAARILTMIAEQDEETAATIGRLIHELLLEMVRDSGSATEIAAAGGRAAPHATS